MEDSQTKLITCEYCVEPVPCWTMRKSSILQITIYTRQPLPAKTRETGPKIALGAGLACAGVLLAAFILSSGSGSSSGRGPLRRQFPPTPARPDTWGRKGKQGGSPGGETAPKADSPLFHAMTWEMFQKEPSEISPEDLAGVRYLKVETSLKQTGYGTASTTLTAKRGAGGADGLLWGHGLGSPRTRRLYRTGETGFGVRLSRVRTLKGLKELKGITAGNVEISGIKDMLDDPAQITELQLKGITLYGGNRIL